MSSSQIKIILISLLAGLIYGSWAAFANFEHGTAVAAKAGIGQGIYALASTWLVTLTAVYVYHKLKGGWLGFCCGFGSSFLVMLSIPLLIHSILLTPNVWQAILPGLIWGSGYIFIYLLKQRIPEEG